MGIGTKAVVVGGRRWSDHMSAERASLAARGIYTDAAKGENPLMQFPAGPVASGQRRVHEYKNG